MTLKYDERESKWMNGSGGDVHVKHMMVEERHGTSYKFDLIVREIL